MKSMIKIRWKVQKAFFLLVSLFALTFLLRWVYEIYFSYNDVIVSYSGSYSYDYDVSDKVTNVASARISQKDVSGQEITIDQKYEKTAQLSSGTADFNSDNQKLRQAIDANEAVIQMENLTGLPGAQSLAVTIGVMPERFDGLVDEIKTIGSLKSFSVNKVDKTSEFKSLMAEQETLRKTRESYIAIKEKGGSIQDLLLLEDKILEVEKSLQETGVDIGLYSSENSFCTVNFTLNETNRHEVSLRFVFTCAKRSLFWTAAAYAVGAIGIFFALGAVAAALALLNYIRKISSGPADTGKNDTNDTNDTDG